MNSMQNDSIDVVVVGAGMIVLDQILPSLYQLQREGRIGQITLAARRSGPLRELAEHPALVEAFPKQKFIARPSLESPLDQIYSDSFQGVIAEQSPHGLVVVAVPDQLHHVVITEALQHDQHVLTVKPFVLEHAQSIELEKLAREKGLFVGVEYHKRFDRRSLDARRQYRAGRLGEFKCGEAKLIEPWSYRHSNFQNWFQCEHTDPFTYIGCHYADLVYFITGLRPVEVSVRGVKGEFPNGKDGFMWSAGVVRFEGGGLLSVINGLGYPDKGAGSNDQAMCLYFEGGDSGAILKHNDQFRGVTQGFIDDGTNEPPFHFVNPDYFRLVPWDGEGLRPVGYGFDSIEANVMAAIRVRTASASAGAQQSDGLAQRQSILKQIDDRGLIATPANSSVNELLVEAGRMSMLHDGQAAAIDYEPPGVRLRG